MEKSHLRPIEVFHYKNTNIKNGIIQVASGSEDNKIKMNVKANGSHGNLSISDGINERVGEGAS